MKVWVVSGYIEERAVAVFSIEEKAQDFCSRMNTAEDSPIAYEYEEFDIDLEPKREVSEHGYGRLVRE